MHCNRSCIVQTGSRIIVLSARDRIVNRTACCSRAPDLRATQPQRYGISMPIQRLVQWYCIKSYYIKGVLIGFESNYIILWIKTLHFLTKGRSHLVAIVPMVSCILKSTSKFDPLCTLDVR